MTQFILVEVISLSVFWAPEKCAQYLKFSHNLLSDLAVYDAYFQTDPTICHFLLHFPVTHQEISTFQGKNINSNTQKICMHVTKLLIFNLKESYFKDFLA